MQAQQMVLEVSRRRQLQAPNLIVREIAVPRLTSRSAQAALSKAGMKAWQE